MYVDMVVQSGISFDAFGLAMQFGKNQAGMHIRDMMQISAALDYFAPIAKPLYITEVEVPSQNGSGLYDGKVAGIWHEEWDQSRQEQWIEQFYKIALSKPFVERVTYSNLADTDDSAIANSGLLTAQLEPKESFRTLKKLHNAIFGGVKVNTWHRDKRIVAEQDSIICVLFSFERSCLHICLFCGFELWQIRAAVRNQVREPNKSKLCAASKFGRLPGIGDGRAKAIVAYRENFSERQNGKAFRNCDDLQKVKGIGPKTAEDICEWLKFE